MALSFSLFIYVMAIDGWRVAQLQGPLFCVSDQFVAIQPTPNVFYFILFFFLFSFLLSVFGGLFCLTYRPIYLIHCHWYYYHLHKRNMTLPYIYERMGYHPNGSIDDQCPAFDSEFITILIKQQTIDGERQQHKLVRLFVFFFPLQWMRSKILSFPFIEFL